MIDISWVLDVALKSAAVAVLALLAARLLRHRSAAERSSVLHGGLLAMALVPLLAVLAPRWHVEVPLPSPPIAVESVLPAAEPTLRSARMLRVERAARALRGLRAEAVPAVAATPAGEPHAMFDPATLAGIVYALPALALLMALAMSLSRLRALRLRARPLRDARWDAALIAAKRRSDVRGHVELLHARGVGSPLSWGVRHRVIVLDADVVDPAIAAPLLAHELAHLARHDWLKLLFARCVTALMWFNPMAWWLARRCHQLREEAADDAVLHGDPAALEYAELLLGVARAHRDQPALAAHAMFSGRGAMQHLRQRLARVLDEGQRRAPAVRAWSLGCTAIALAAALPVAAVAPAAKIAANEMAAMTPARVTLMASDEVPATVASHAASATPVKVAGVSGTPVAVPPATVTVSHVPAANAPTPRAADTDDDAGDAGLAFLITPHPRAPSGVVQLALQDIGRHRGSWSSGIPVTQLQGLDSAAMSDQAPNALQFRLARAAGRFDCEGTGQRGKASGFCRFVPDAGFVRELERREIGRPDAHQLRLLALEDARLDVLDELARQKYPVPKIERYVEFAIHGLDAAWLRDLGAAGYHLDGLRKLLEFRIHGIDAAYLAELRDAGHGDLPAQQVLQFRIHDVTGPWIREIGQLGYGKLSAERLLEFAIHDVSADKVRALAGAGYANLPAERLMQFTIHGVTPAYAAELAALGYASLPPERIVEFRIHDVDADLVRGLARAGIANLPPEDLVKFAVHEVTPEFVQALRALGYDRLTADRLVALRIHDVTPEFIRAVNALGYRDVPVDDLVAMRIHDVSPAYIRGKLAGQRQPPSIRDLVDDRIHGD